MAEPILDQINLVVGDMERSIAFYRLIGLDIKDDAIWRTASGAHHVVMRMPDGFELALDSQKLAAVYNAGWQPPNGASENGSRMVISFRLRDAAAVDETYQRVTTAGHRTSQPPYYTFWGSRYAIVVDPDGNHVGLMSPPDPAHKSAPPSI